jgi:hypothetical protein
MADARRREEERLAAPGLEESPLVGRVYDKWAGEFDLSDPKHAQLDEELAAFCRRFAASDADTRRVLRRAISMDEFYTLIAFANRCAVFAIRGRDVGPVEDGLVALAVIDPSRIDFRDAVVAINLLDHAAREIGASAREPFMFAASVAEETMAQRIVEFIGLPASERDIRTVSGFVQIETDHGAGFTRWNLERYRPNCALDRIALAVTRLFAADRYQPSSITLASSLPRVWLIQDDKQRLDGALRAIRAGASIRADLRPSDAYENRHQGLIAFIVELTDERFAQDLFRIAHQTLTKTRPFALTATAARKLFCLIIARSFVDGTSNYESDASLERFTAGVTSTLEEGLRDRGT